MAATVHVVSSADTEGTLYESFEVHKRCSLRPTEAMFRHAYISGNISSSREYFEYRRKIFHVDSNQNWCSDEFYTLASSSHKTKLHSLANGIEDLGNSAFCGLATELIQEVAGYLRGADFLSLRASCRLLASVLENTAIDIYPQQIREEFAWRLHQDWYNRLAQEEKVGNIEHSREAGLALCSICSDVHPMAAFSTEEISKGPENRVCKGFSGYFRTCDNYSWTLRDLLEIRRSFVKWHEENSYSGVYDLECSFEEIDRSSQGSVVQLNMDIINSKQPHRLRNQDLRRSDDGVITYKCSTKLLEISSGQRIEIDDIHKALDLLKIYVCPHLQPPEIVEKLWEIPGAEGLINTNVGGPKLHPILLNSRMGQNSAIRADPVSVLCDNRHCKTVVHIERPYRKNMIVLSIERNIGKLHSAQDPLWLAQLESVWTQGEGL